MKKNSVFLAIFTILIGLSIFFFKNLGNQNIPEAQAVAKATGGTYTESGGYGYHVFTSSGTFTPNESLDVDYLVVAGGGGGAMAEYRGVNGGGGGGAGGILSGTKSVTSTGYTVTIGSGGTGGHISTNSGNGNNGGNSVFDNITATGGGGGGTNSGSNGGSGGGGGGWHGDGGTATSGQGNNGGFGGEFYIGGGGGGKGQIGETVDGSGVDHGGDGGAGQDYSATFTTNWGENGYFGGGGGGSSLSDVSGSGGIGGGGNGGRRNNNSSQNGQANTGGGGGGHKQGAGNAGAGGSGIVIIRYQLPPPTAPTIGTATVLSQTSIQWNFTDNASDETGFKVYDTSNVLKTTCATTNLSSCTETGLTANTEYTRKVVAYNAVGNSTYSSTDTATTLPNAPPAPTNGTATVLSSTSIQWNFTDNASDETGFKVYDTSNVLKATCATANLSSCTETGLTAGTEYTRKVVAYNDGGNSSYSSTNAATTWKAPCAPDIGDTTHTITGDCSFSTSRGTDADGKTIYGMDPGTGGTNSSALTLQNGTLTITSTEHLLTGSINMTGGSIAIATGGKISPGGGIYYSDSDSDGYPSSTTPTIGFSAPANYRRRYLMNTTATAECDDSDATLYQNLDGYVDSDGDDYGTGDLVTNICSGASLPSGYADNATDCDDNTNSGTNTCTICEGGTETDVGGDKVHTFTASGTLTCYSSKSVQYLIVGGGGGAGGNNSCNWAHGSGGGSGGVLTGSTSVSSQIYTITVGAGGSGNFDGPGNNGGNSSALGLTATGGGRGGGHYFQPPADGGSGGGGVKHTTFHSVYSGPGWGTSGQGNNGGQGSSNNSGNQSGNSGGGGGAGEAGNTDGGVTGGDGIQSSISGSTVTYGGGGGGSGWGVTATGGDGGGGTGCNVNNSSCDGQSGTANTGGGGGGGTRYNAILYDKGCPCWYYECKGSASLGRGGNGGSGIVVVRYTE